MPTHDYELANNDGAGFRQDLNSCLRAIRSNNSDSSEPSPNFPYQWYVDSGSGTLKIRNADDNAYINVGAVGALGVAGGSGGTANLGLALSQGPSFSADQLGFAGTFNGNVKLTGSGFLDIPAGTTQERPSTPNNGMIRYNSTLSRYEGYSGQTWGTLGGGAVGGGTDKVFYTNEKSITSNFTLVGTLNAMSAGPISIASGVSVTISSGATWTVV